MRIILLFALTLLAMAQLSHPNTEIRYVDRPVIKEVEVVKPVVEVIEKPVIEYVDRPVVVEKEVVKEVKIPCTHQSANFWEGEYYRLKVDMGRKNGALSRTISSMRKEREKDLERREKELDKRKHADYVPTGAGYNGYRYRRTK